MGFRVNAADANAITIDAVVAIKRAIGRAFKEALIAIHTIVACGAIAALAESIIAASEIDACATELAFIAIEGGITGSAGTITISAIIAGAVYETRFGAFNVAKRASNARCAIAAGAFAIRTIVATVLIAIQASLVARWAVEVVGAASAGRVAIEIVVAVALLLAACGAGKIAVKAGLEWGARRAFTGAIRTGIAGSVVQARAILFAGRAVLASGAGLAGTVAFGAIVASLAESVTASVLAELA